MLYAYFGGLSADKQTMYELVLEQCGSDYTLTAILAMGQWHSDLPKAFPRWGWLRQPRNPGITRQIYAGTDARRGLLILLQKACAANLATLGQRYCYVLPSVPSQAGALAVLVPHQLRYDNSLPFHPQLWQLGRPLDTLPAERHAQAYERAGERDGRGNRRSGSGLRP